MAVEESGWTRVGAHRAVMRALRGWLQAGGGARVPPLVERRVERARAARVWQRRRDERGMEDRMWQFRHAHLPGVPDLPVVAAGEHRVVRIGPSITKYGRQVARLAVAGVC